MTDLFKLSRQPRLQNSSFIVGFSEDAGRLAPKVIDYLNKSIKGGSFCEIEPVDFFPLSGVAVENDVAQFPESKLYCGERNDLVVFKGSQPRLERHKFLQTILDVAKHYCGTTELYTVSGTIATIAHTTPRSILAVFNQRRFQDKLRGYGLQNMTWEGPPAFNSFLLWVAQGRGIPGVSLWPAIPFYLASVDDFRAQRKVLEFFHERFDLGIDFRELAEKEASQNEKIAELRSRSPETDSYIRRVESNLTLTQEENEKLVKQVEEFLEVTD